MFRLWRLTCISLLTLAWLGAAGVTVGWLALRGSLATLEGERRLVGLEKTVVVARDEQGVPTIQAATREDAMRALGFLHAQERFFQMDLMRRQAAGELAELFGPAAVALDLETRRHRFRARNAGILARFSPEELRALDAYVAGVNAGLTDLAVRPWEYLVLRTNPRPWTREDSLFVVESMTLALQEHDGIDERTRQAIRATYGDTVLAFLRPTITPASAALDGSVAPLPPVPDASTMQPRLASHAWLPSARAPASPWFLPEQDGEAVSGSNSFALAGNRVEGGAALIGNDMHLNLAVPNTWYRASLSTAGRVATGATLPGVPGVIVGSNGEVAWSFTDAYADTTDVVVVERDPADPQRYRVPDGTGWERFEEATEVVQVAGQTARSLKITSTRWGPLLTPAEANTGPTLALHWTAYEAGAFNLRLLEMADAHNTEEALTLAHQCGLPAQNFLVGDRAGNIAWTIIGRIPKRVGFIGDEPASWADGTCRWEGFLPPEQMPVIRNPPGGQLWTANNRVIGGEGFRRLGNGGYDLPFRAAQIRDDLAALSNRYVKPGDTLQVQLDDEARFLTRWRELLEQTLDEDAARHEPRLRELGAVVRAWHGHAAAQEAGHRLVRDFRQNVLEAVMNPIYEPVRRNAPELHLSRTRFKDAEEPLWAIVSARPPHLLPSSESTWPGLLLHAARLTAKMGIHQPGGSSLADCTWGKVNTLRMRHPFSALLPDWLATKLDMPAQPMPGDNNLPRVQGPSFGASERMDVCPGHEAQGIYHQPGGASGHPLSPFYRRGHMAWVQGQPTAFLPGPTKYRLVLVPGA